MTDWQLIEAYRAGDEEAFATLVQKYYALVYGAACRQVCDAHLAKDISQCVFVLFSRKARTLCADVTLGGWFLRTVRFVALNVVRKNRHQQRLENELLMTETTETPDFDPIGPLASLQEAILALSAGEQACLLGKYYEGKSFEEIGAELNISGDAVGKRVARALEKLRIFYQRRGMKVSIAAIPAILMVGLSVPAHGAEAQGVAALLAALKGHAASRPAASLAEQAAHALARQQLLTTAAKIALILILAGPAVGWYTVNRQPPVPPRAAFQVSDGRIVTLGRGWNDVMQRASLIRHRFQRAPAPGDARVAALREENKSLFRDRMALSWGLTELSKRESLRNLLPSYLSCGLAELLTLNTAQRAFVFDWARQSLPADIEQDKVAVALEADKPALAASVRSILSARQRSRFDQVCGANAEFLLINRTSYGRAPGYLAWQDWLGAGGIMTPEEAMATVPPHLW